MNTTTKLTATKVTKTLVKCALCKLDVPLDEAVVPEVTDELVYLCGLDCYARWRSTASASFPSLLPEAGFGVEHNSGIP